MYLYINNDVNNTYTYYILNYNCVLITKLINELI